MLNLTNSNCQKSKLCSKIEIMFKNRNFGQKTKFWSKIKILVNNFNFEKKILVKTFCHFIKSEVRGYGSLLILPNRDFQTIMFRLGKKYWLRFAVKKNSDILYNLNLFNSQVVHCPIFEQNLDFWQKYQFFSEISISNHNFDFWPKFRFLTKISIFEQNCDFRPKFRFLIKIWKSFISLNFPF